MRRTLALGLVGLAALAAFSQPALAAGGAGVIEGRVSPLEVASETEVCLLESPPSEICTVPGPKGTYALYNLPVGPQQVEFIPSFRSGYIPQYYNHKLRPAEATTVTLTPEQPKASGIDAELVRGGVISGEVTAQLGGSPLAEVEVCARTTSTLSTRSCTRTDPAGEYVLHSLLPGSYKVGFWGRGASAEYQPQYYAGKAGFGEATVVTVAQGAEVSAIDASLAKGSEIDGTVRAAATGDVLSGISVCLFAAAASGPQGCTYSNQSGAYLFQGLPSGSYQVGFSLSRAEIGGEVAGDAEDGYLAQFYAGGASRAEAQTIPLVAPQLKLGVDAHLLAPSAPPPAPPPVVPPALVPAAPPVAVPPVKKGCKKGYRKQKVKGKTRCVKAAKRKHHRHRHGKKSQGRPHGQK